MGSCAAPSAKGDDKFITTDYLQQCRQAYQVSVTGQHNIHCEVVNKEGNPCFGVMFEIDQGVPALHINTGGDMLLHIHCAHNGLVLTPDASGQRFEKAPVDRFAYNSPSLLLSAD
ncbi:hypothetical protein BK268_25395 [Escherichia coli]|uniref:hypothetical protein n=1 Tax=Escherichia coli TaxID=562 RepID=UPI0009296861|nr:hypothetical protein [Escherichia coli]OJL70768.1 hypothetical protein BK268_25395 [Escherichia coli]